MEGVLLLLLVVLCVAMTSTFGIGSTVTTYPDFQQLSVEPQIAAPAANTYDQQKQQLQDDVAIDSSESGHGRWKVKVVHRDKIFPSTAAAHVSNNKKSQGTQAHAHAHHESLLFHARMKRDVKRVHTLMRRLANHPNHENDKMEDSLAMDFGSEVVSGMEQGSGEYFVRIGVGSPPRSQYVVIDSGSDIVWVQCQPCSHCYIQSDPIFDPAHSASYSGVSCTSSVCDRLQSPSAHCHAGRCCYEASYGDGSYTQGTLALETLTFGGALIRNVAIGCGHVNRGMFVGAAGLLGLGGGPMSFVGQLAGQTGAAFSYCLVSRGDSSGTGGSLEFGRAAMPVGATWVPLIKNPRAPTFYYVGLAGLGVGGARVLISEDYFRQTELGYGGVVMDTGTAVTRFPASAYVAFRDAFIQQTANLPRVAGSVSIFDTCYDLNGFVSVRVPTVSFYFSGGPVLTLPARNFLIPVDEKGTFCLAFAPSPDASGLSIIGNIQQEGIQISFDGANGFVGFGPSVC